MSFAPKKKPRKPRVPEEKLKVRVVYRPPKVPAEFRKPEAKPEMSEQTQPPAVEVPKETFKVKSPTFRTTFLKEILPILVAVVVVVASATILLKTEKEGATIPGTTTGTSTPTTTTTIPGTTTGTSTPTTTTTSEAGPAVVNLLQGAVPYEEDYPPLTKVSYTTSGGIEITDIDAYDGLIVLLVEHGTSRTQVSDLVQSLGGELVMELPEGGVYWVQYKEGMDVVLYGLIGDPSVVDAFPLFPLVAKGSERVDATYAGWAVDAIEEGKLDSSIVIIDLWDGTDHGDEVSQIASEQEGAASASKTEVDVFKDGPKEVRNESVLIAIGLAAINAHESGRVTAINLSLGAENVLPAGDWHGVTSPDVIEQKVLLFQSLEETLHFLEGMNQEYLDHILITIAAGNEGLDITDVLYELKGMYPRAWDHVIIAGGLDEHNQRIREFNTSENPDDILYAQMPGELYGTSFAAPQFTGLIAAIAAERPDLTASQIKRAILDAAPVINAYRTKPSLEAVLNILTTTTTTPHTTSTVTPTSPPLNAIWEGTFTILSTSRINGQEYGGQEVVGSIRLKLEQNGSKVIGLLEFSNVQVSIKFNYAPFDYMEMSVPDYGEVAGTVTSDGSLEFTQFWIYAPFTANVAGDVMSADFDKTFVSELDVIIILFLPGQKSKQVMGPSETTDSVSFNLRKVEDLAPNWLSGVPTPALIG
jgi:hypothetical protein